MVEPKCPLARNGGCEPCPPGTVGYDLCYGNYEACLIYKIRPLKKTLLEIKELMEGKKRKKLKVK